MEEALAQLQSKDTKERMAGVERLQTLLEQCRKSLSSSETASLVDASMSLLKDNNFKVCQGALQALASAAAVAGEHLKLHFGALLPAIVERLGDSKQPVRDAGRRLLLALMEISSPTTIVERAGAFAWGHKNWRVREEFARTAASAINLFTATELPFQRLLLPSVLQLLEDSNSNVREAAMLCLEEMFRQGGQQFGDELQRHQLRPTQLKEITCRFEKIEPLRSGFDTKHQALQSITPNRHSGAPNNYRSGNQQSLTNHQWPVTESKSSVLVGNARGNSPKSKPANSEGDNVLVEKPAEPVRVFSEKELAKEIEKVASMLSPVQDWSVRMAGMQRIEGLVAGGAIKYSCFTLLFKQLVNPLSDQLADRRSSIVKQACQLLKLLCKELGVDFEIFAESFLPMLFKLVVITVLVIAESADLCIKSILLHCKVARILPKMIELAKHDRNAVLRARCCEYSLLFLEQWCESPEVQRSAELYEDLVKCCCGDAMSEVRSIARQCYRVFARCWPDRARRLFHTFDPVIQRHIHDEDGGFPKKYGSAAVNDMGVSHQFRHSTAPVPGHPSKFSGSSIPLSGHPVSMTNGHTNTLVSGSGPNLLQKRSSESASERSLESVLQASQQQVTAIETMLKGAVLEDKGSFFPVTQTGGNMPGDGTYSRIHPATAGWPLRSGVEPPSTQDPAYPANLRSTAFMGSNMPSYHSGNASKTVSGIHNFHDLGSGKIGDYNGMNREAEVAGKAQTAKRVPANTQKYNLRNIYGDSDEIKSAKRIPKLDGHLERLLPEATSNVMPAYQRPLLRQSGAVRSSSTIRNSIEDSYPAVGMNFSGEASAYMDGLTSLNDALTEGLSPGADWSSRVAAFTFLRKSLQQGNKGLQEVGQSFERVMRLFSEHLDDPHHKVAHAALSALVELVPACRKAFETYLERILPHVFARLVDAKEVIRLLSTSALETVGNTYSIDALLPALLRSLDEQRSPKAKMAVIEFAIAAFTKLALNGEASGGSGLLKLWLAKLAPLVHDKNPKLKETAVTGLISVYTHFDSTIVLNFILGLSIEEQGHLRRALKHYTPRVEVDLMTFMQNRSQRNKAKPCNDRMNYSASAEGKEDEITARGAGLGGLQTLSSHPSTLHGSNGAGQKWNLSCEPDSTYLTRQEGAPSTMTDQRAHLYRSYEFAEDLAGAYGHSKDASNGMDSITEAAPSWLSQSQVNHVLSVDGRHDVLPTVDTDGGDSGACLLVQSGSWQSSEPPARTQAKVEDTSFHQKASSAPQSQEVDVYSVLQMSRWDGGKSVVARQEALQQVVQLSCTNDPTIWSKYDNQLVTLVLDSLDDTEASIRELALSAVLEMLKNQRDILEKDTEIVLEKLLHSARDTDLKVSAAADLSLNAVLTQLDTYRCLSVIVPLLVCEDEKVLVTCISCLTKLVSRLAPDDLVSQLHSFLPMLFDAFGNQDADVRKTVVFCLVEIYIVLGKAFVPYLGSLSSTQLRLVTIYANRISQKNVCETLQRASVISGRFLGLACGCRKAKSLARSNAARMGGQAVAQPTDSQ